MIKREVGPSSVAKAVTFFGLLLCAGLFVKKNWEAYQSRATSMIFSTEIIEHFENPTIVFCFAPAPSSVHFFVLAHQLAHRTEVKSARWLFRVSVK